MNGDVVAAKMKRIKSHVPFLLLSAYEPPQMLTSTLRLGVGYSTRNLPLPIRNSVRGLRFFV